MSDNLKLEYKIGSIEFKAEGSAEAVEQQRVNFMNAVLPAAVEAMVRTQSTTVQAPLIEADPQPPMLQEATQAENVESGAAELGSNVDLARTSLSSYLKPFGKLTEQNFTLFAAYFHEKKNQTHSFSIDEVKGYYAEARRPLPKNPSMSIHRLVEKGYIMDTDAPEGASAGNYYMLTRDGILFVENYTPKANTGDKTSPVKVRKSASKAPSYYCSLNADDLNISNYPAVKNLRGSKEQVIMTMYIVTKEDKGVWFTVDDVVYLLENIFEVSSNGNIVYGIFRRNKSMFAVGDDPESNRKNCRKLLSGAKDFAEDIINSNS